jgi:D-glycero-D-manno-heptose 1,7-bisphosphate phosphatase
MKKAVFLDRDGTLNNNDTRYYISRREDLRLNPGVVEALAGLQSRGYLLIVITNQGGIGKGETGLKEVEELHTHLRSMLEKEGIHLEEIYTCPHYPTTSTCLCRKPRPLLIEKAMARFDIDPAASWMIGDSRRDTEAGQAAGVRTILIEPNSDLRQVLEIVDRG